MEATDTGTGSTTRQPAHDEAINRRSIGDMSDDEIDAMLDSIRSRRLVAYTHYAAARNVKLGAAFLKKLGVAEKRLAMADKAMTKFEEAVLDIRALRLQMED